MNFMQQNSEEAKKFTISTAVENNAPQNLGQQILTQEVMSDSKAPGLQIVICFQAMLEPHGPNHLQLLAPARKFMIYTHTYLKNK
jgi:hypothetical protein